MSRTVRRRLTSISWLTLGYGAALMLPGALLVLLIVGFGTPFDGLAAYDAYREDSDGMMRLVGTIAAMREPIDWGAPIALSSVNSPYGSTMVYIDGMPIVTIALRFLAQLGGLWIDPAATLNAIMIVSLVAAPAVASIVARALGANRPMALTAGALVVWLAPLVWFAHQRQQSILPWMPVAIVVAAAIGVERGQRFSRWAMAAALLSWWIHAYHGAMASMVLGITAVMVLRRAPRVAGQMIATAVIAPLTIVALGGIGRVNDGGVGGIADIGGIATFLDARILGLPLLFDLDVAFAWGILLPIAALIGGRLLLREAPAAAVVALLSAVIATGAVSGGGLLPDSLLEQLPLLGIFRYTDRFALLTALILFGATAATVSLWIARPRTSQKRHRRQLIAVFIGIVVFAAQMRGILSTENLLGANRVFAPYPPALAAAEQELVAAHERLHPEPFHACPIVYDRVGRSRLGMEAHFNLIAAMMGMPSTSMQVVRYPPHDCAIGTPLLPDDLLLLLDPALPTPPALACAPLGGAPADGIGIRVCSARERAITRYLERVEAIESEER